MAMDAKDLRAESALAERSSDGGAKYTHTAAALHYERGKQGQEVASNSFKVDGQGTRPCAVIGPDRVAPPPRDAFPKKAPVEPWLGQDTVYRRPPEYPHKVVEYQDPTRNISPRQTFQENMQRIIMPPGYNVVKLNEDPTYASKSTKLNVPAEVKYYDVPYNVNPMSSDQKNSRNVDHSVSNVNPLLVKNMPHGWPPGSVNVRPLRQYGAPEIYQYSDFGSCAGPRPTLTRHHTGHEEPSQLYPDPYYHDANIRFKPYPNIKERYPQASKDNVKIVPVDTYNYSKHTTKNQEELYVLGLVNVPREELSKYEHIQKVSKLPKNIKGYNSLELLNQFEEAIESSNMANIEPTKRDGQIQQKNVAHKQDTLPRAVSPLDVEAKISQSVIHKDVGCNFEIKPCSPKMLNVEVAAPVQTVLNERVIEKVANPLNMAMKQHNKELKLQE
ncbi:hypothetical protein MSG28_010830 [Choristoneura fumiferana]|uniref:Uncharacterized protein n=1 Tax=Choristoneura fumiferana TaxID=7141 RepID=A0ACC0KPZ2_CHOFU|nr:hypothetical protein MSG28_010830 [Choristoneura fumiferana]